MSRRGLNHVVVVALVAALFGALAAQASANAEIHEFSVTRSTAQAGGHPDMNVTFKVDYWDSPQLKQPCQCNTPKNIDLELPTGIIGNPHATPQCTATAFLRQQCPSDAQVGLIYLKANIGGSTVFDFEQPLWNMVPRPSQAGLLAWQIPVFEGPIYTVLGARTDSDYGLDAFTDGVLQRFSIVRLRQEMWGVPADPSHDSLRVGIPNNGPSEGLPSSSPLTPFLSNPTSCEGPQTSTLRVLAYDRGTSQASSTWGPTTGCDQLPFNPSLSAQPTTTETDSASGLEVNLTVPQEESPTTPSPSEIRGATVELPVGVSINPNAADGKTSCSDAEARVGTQEEAQCPEFSKVGTDTLESSALPGPLPGAIYLGDPLPGNRYRVILTADGFATHIKLVGSARPDPRTGQIVVSFEELPQAPLTEFNLHFFGSERGILATPTKCGSYAVHSTFVPWDGAESQQATQVFNLDSGPDGKPCPAAQRPFEPGFQASSESNDAGTYTPFSIYLKREDGDQNLSGLSVSPPAGLLASLKGIPYCSDAALAGIAQPGYTGLSELSAPVCPAASQIGVTSTSAGAGTHPVSLAGKVYLAGPYKGAPVSLAVVTPAVTGPYDLGNVVVRAALDVDPETARVTAVSDPLPQIIEGIPLRLRSILVTLNRPGFTINPTNCEQFSVAATIAGDEGGSASPTSPFQAANCANLSYGPKLDISLDGGVNRRGHPAIHAKLTTGAGEANSKRISVALPVGEQLDNSHFGTVCTKPLFLADNCPAGSMIGEAEARSPLLDQPLRGKVYLRTSSHGLPNMAIALKGQIDVTLVGEIDSAKPGRLRSTFNTVPDAPISSFSLDLQGGHKGLVQNSESLCGRQKKATVEMTGQNGMVVDRSSKIDVACGGKARHKRHAGRVGA